MAWGAPALVVYGGVLQCTAEYGGVLRWGRALQKPWPAPVRPAPTACPQLQLPNPAANPRTYSALTQPKQVRLLK